MITDFNHFNGSGGSNGNYNTTETGNYNIIADHNTIVGSAINGESDIIETGFNNTTATDNIIVDDYNENGNSGVVEAA
jgi:hypothetical protein